MYFKKNRLSWKGIYNIEQFFTSSVCDPNLLLYLVIEKTETDLDREKNLMSQWLALADERNNVLVPQPGSGVPGAPATG